MRRPGSNECLQDKPRNRHFAEWRFLLFTIIVTVNRPICNVIRIGVTSSRRMWPKPPAVVAVHVLNEIVAFPGVFCQCRSVILRNPFLRC